MDQESYSDDFHLYELHWTPDYLRFKYDGKVVLNVNPPNGKSFGQWGELGNFDPWKGEDRNAPFNQEFYLIINLAVGGTNGYFPDGCNNGGNGAKPWNNGEWWRIASKSFWDRKDRWEHTWQGEDAALQIKEFKVESL